VKGYRKLSTGGSSASSQHEDDDVELVDDKTIFNSSRSITRGRQYTIRTCTCFAFALVTALLLIVSLFNILQKLISPGLPSLDISLGPDVERSKCCSERLAYVPRDDVLPIHAHEAFRDSHIIEQWIADGELVKDVDLSSHVRIDAVTTWVNGSDPRHVANRLIFAQQPAFVNTEIALTEALRNHTAELESGVVKDVQAHNIAIQNSDNRYREFDELRYSVRSTRMSLAHHLGTHHIISTDFWKSNQPAKGTVDFLSGDRRGQIPFWLDHKSPYVAFGEREKRKVPAIRMHHDWDIFVPFDPLTDVNTWKSQRLPTFSSLAAEAMIGVSMPGLAQTYILGSDDMFLHGNLTTADFFTPLFGTVIHLDMTSFYNGWTGAFRGHETTGFHYDATLLKKRFGTPGIPYPAHVNKANVQPISVETRTIWRKEFQEASSRRFRGDGWTINSHSLTFFMQIERHREALLWSYFVAKIDSNGDGALDAVELRRMLQELGANNITSSIAVKLPRRSSNNQAYRDNLLNHTRFPLPGATRYSFSSFDGYPFIQPERPFIKATGLTYRQTPFSVDDQDIEANARQGLRRFETTICHVELLSCWPRDDRGRPAMTTAELFRNFAFRNRRCGDCLIAHLVGKSGRKGLGAFLPPPEVPFPEQAIAAAQTGSRDQTAAAYHLPLTNSWVETDFSLKSIAVLNGLGKSTSAWSLPSRRTFVAHLLARYAYSLGTSTTKLEMLNKPKGIQVKLRRLRQLVPRLAFFCINDDLEMPSSSSRSVRDSLQGFFESVWPTGQTRMPFEKQDFDFIQIEENLYPYSSAI
jgi:hypothetical protein